jgi:hypothetical protein
MRREDIFSLFMGSFMSWPEPDQYMGVQITNVHLFFFATASISMFNSHTNQYASNKLGETRVKL